MGLWSKGTRRKLRAHEFRIEVVFETPVIFLAPPDNKRGPIPGRNIYYLDGTEMSYKNTRILGPTAQKQAGEQAIARVHTADDERASWVTLLSTLQREEGDSRKWDDEIRNKAPTAVRITPPEYKLAVGLQSKTRSWDFMPAAVTKPYATSAVCHLVEMMAMLGIYWKVFDQIQWSLRAEGNGFILTSTMVDGLGVMVVFAITGKSRFLENRVIPTKDIKELCFGTVPNIFDNLEYPGREKDAQSLDLIFGTSEEVSTTLESLGCTSDTLKRYEKDHKHIFSGKRAPTLSFALQSLTEIAVSFEIIGMLGKVFRIRGSSFRMIPNPTSDHWLKNNGPKASWKITRMMEVFQDKLRELSLAEDLGPGHPTTAISDQWKIIQGHNPTDEAHLSIEVREAIHNALDESTEYLLGLGQLVVLSVLVTERVQVRGQLRLG